LYRGSVHIYLRMSGESGSGYTHYRTFVLKVKLKIRPFMKLQG
jgi:hypothetical protein